MMADGIQFICHYCRAAIRPGQQSCHEPMLSLAKNEPKQRAYHLECWAKLQEERLETARRLTEQQDVEDKA